MIRVRSEELANRGASGPGSEFFDLSARARWVTYRRAVLLAEAFLFVTLFVLPPVLGVATALLHRPWWWGAALAVVLALVATIAPTPEAGQPRVAWGDVPFLLVVVAWVTGLVLLTNFLTRRFWLRRREVTPDST